jgi:hypothetical protein
MDPPRSPTKAMHPTPSKSGRRTATARACYEHREQARLHFPESGGAEAHFADRRAKKAREFQAAGAPKALPAAASAALTATTSRPKLTKEGPAEAAVAFVGGPQEGQHGTHLVIYADSAIGRCRKKSVMSE